jgi:peroxiredoxin
MVTKNLFAETLAKIKASTAEWFGSANDKLVRGLIKSGAAERALKPGDRVPEFMLPNAEGRLVQSQRLFGKQPVVLKFYRGVWCPYCSAELNALADASEALTTAGASVVAITPETGGAALRTKKERDLPFEILCDVDNGVAMEFGLMFRIPDDIRPAYERAGVKLSTFYGNDSWMLPIPATYVVGKDGVIAHAYVNSDYRERCDPATLIDAIAKLN